MSTGKRPSVNRQNLPFTVLTGPSYSLPGNTERFKLPPTSYLQPGMDNCQGQLDSWPVHAIKSVKSNLSLGKSSQFGSKDLKGHPRLSLQEEGMSPAHIYRPGTDFIPKPKFLEQLESFLSRELRLLGCPPTGPHELRLQAHREVFEYLIEDFKTYKPLLSAIKNEYELFLEYQQELIKELEPMEAHLETVRESCERKIMNIKEGDRQEDAAVRMENQTLQKGITDMQNSELSYKAQIKKLEEHVQDLYKKYRYEADARKLLITEFNNLKHQQQEQKGDQDEAGTGRQPEDPVLLKLKLIRTREDLRVAHQKINTMLADYGDVVPKRDFEMLESSFKTIETEMDALKNDHGMLIVEHSTLQSLYKNAVDQKDEMKDDLSQFKRSATPRPDWDRCSSYIGAEKWADLTSGSSSDRKVDVLLAHISGVDVAEINRQDTFQGQGLGENVPSYLKHEGPVRNRHITRSETNKLIKGFWHHRLTIQEDQPIDESLFAFLLAHNNQDEGLAIEDGYNLQESVSRFGHEPHIHLFGQVVRGKLSETVFSRWLTTQKILTETFNELQVEENVITEDKLKEILSSNLPGKSDDQLQALASTAIKIATVQPGMLNYIKMLTLDREGQPSEFVLLLLEQSRKESKSFVTELMQAFSGKSEVTLTSFKSTLKELDPAKPTEDLHILLSTLFSIPVEKVTVGEAQQLATPITQLVERLQYCELSRTSM